MSILKVSEIDQNCYFGFDNHAKPNEDAYLEVIKAKPDDLKKLLKSFTYAKEVEKGGYKTNEEHNLLEDYEAGDGTLTHQAVHRIFTHIVRHPEENITWHYMNNKRGNFLELSPHDRKQFKNVRNDDYVLRTFAKNQNVSWNSIDKKRL